MRFAWLGSGSRGNAGLIEAGQTRLLLDCGFTAKETERRLARLGLEPADLAGVLVTHEHRDHIAGVSVLARRHRLPVWMTPGTHRQAGDLGELPGLALFNCHEPFAVGDLQVEPFPVPHDAREPSQFVFSDGARRLGVLTDAGRSTPHVEAVLAGCDGLLLECNHDADMLADGPYPPTLKARVGGGHGHLSNAQAAELLGRLDTARLQHIAALHLSEENNRPGLAREALGAALGCGPDWVATAGQAEGLDWRQLT